MTTIERMRLATLESRLLKSMTPAQHATALRIARTRRTESEAYRRRHVDAARRRTLDDTAERMRRALRPGSHSSQ